MRDAWLALTGAISHAETEVQKRFYETLGVSPDANLGVELMARVKKNREEFERRIDEGVKAAVAKVRAPIDKEIAHAQGARREAPAEDRAAQEGTRSSHVRARSAEGQGHHRHRRRHRPRQVDGRCASASSAPSWSCRAASRTSSRPTAAEFEAKGITDVLVAPADVRVPDEVDAMVEAAVDRFGRVDVLINNAAGNFLQMTEKLSPNAFAHGHRHRPARHASTARSPSASR